MKKKGNWALGLSIGVIVISIIAFGRSFIRTDTDIDYLGILIGILTLIVAIIAIIFGFNMFGLKGEMKAYIDERIQEQNKEIHDFNIDLETDIAKSFVEIFQIEAEKAHEDKRYDKYIFYLVSNVYYKFKANDANLIMSIAIGNSELSGIIKSQKGGKIELYPSMWNIISQYFNEMRDKIANIKNLEDTINDNIEIKKLG